MGNFASQETDVAVKSFIGITNDVMTSVRNDASLNCSAGQEFQLSSGIGCDFQCLNCNLDEVQLSNIKCSLSTDNETTIRTQFSAQIDTAIDNWIKQQASQTNGWLATGLNLSTSGINSQTDLKEQLKTLVTTDIISTCSTELNGYQSSKINLCGDWSNSTLSFTQDALTLALASCVNKTLVQAYSRNSILQTFVNTTDQAVAQQNAGLLDTIYWIVAAFLIISLVSLILYYTVGNRQPVPNREVIVRPAMLRPVSTA